MVYEDLFILMEKDSEARAYFEQLPVFVKEAVRNKPLSMNSYERLRAYAENLLHH